MLPRLSLFTTGTRQIAQNVITLCKQSFIKIPPHFRHVSDFSRGSEPLHCGMCVNYRKLRESITGHLSAQWRSIKDCFRAICSFGVGLKRAKGYDREASTVNEVKSNKNPGPHFKCSGFYFQNTCKKYTNIVSNMSLGTLLA